MKWWAFKNRIQRVCSFPPIFFFFFFFCWGRRMRHLHYAARSLLLGFCWAIDWRGFSETTHNYSLVTMNMQALSNQHAQISNGNNQNTCWTPCFFPCSHSSHLWTFYHITNPHRLWPTVRASFPASVPHSMTNLTDAFNSISDLENIRKPEGLRECGTLWASILFFKKKFKI